MNKEDNFKEKFKQALISTIKVISEDYRHNKDNNNTSSKNINFFQLTLNNLLLKIKKKDLLMEK